MNNGRPKSLAARVAVVFSDGKERTVYDVSVKLKRKAKPCSRIRETMNDMEGMGLLTGEFVHGTKIWRAAQ